MKSKKEIKICSECGNKIECDFTHNGLKSKDGVCFASIFGWQCNKCFKEIWRNVRVAQTERN